MTHQCSIEISDLGRDAVDAGAWSEYHQKKSRTENNPYIRNSHQKMYDFWNEKYQKLKMEYFRRRENETISNN